MDIESNNRNSAKFIPHPILDDPTKMMRIIANPLYDRLTISRAAHIRKHNPAEYVRKSARLNRSREKTIATPLKSLNNEETKTTSLSTDNNNQTQSKSISRRRNPPPFRLPTPSPTNRISSRNMKTSIRSRNHSSLMEKNKKPITDGTIRYVNNDHGFEVHRYSSRNWLSVDIISKDACESQEKSFLEMLDKKEQEEFESRGIYTTDYYRQRWDDLLESYKDGYLTHNQWAKQNYQLYCLKTFYLQAFEREQQRIELHAKNLRERRAENVFNKWKESKNGGNIERHRSHSIIDNNQRRIEVTSALSNPSLSLLNNSTNRMSISSIVNNDSEELPLCQPINLSKNTTVISNALYMLDQQRWSLESMLKRVVGLAEPLSPLPQIINHPYSSLTNLSSDSGFESGL